MKSDRPTIVDVAERAGVSWKTVSRVINREPNVSAKTVQRVKQAIAELDYEPNPAARSLAGARSYLIGAIADNPSAHYIGELHRGAAKACRERGYHLALEEVSSDLPGWVDDFEASLKRVKFDGAIVVPPLTDDTKLLDALDRQGIRYLRISPATDFSRSDAIFARDELGVAELVRHLWDLGHRALGIIEGPPDHRASQVRLMSFLAEVDKLGGDPSAVQRAEGDFSIESGIVAAKRLLSAKRPPTAIFAANDAMAAGVIAAAGEMGLRIPDALSVAGFDDSEIASFVWPKLTTVSQAIPTLARLAVEMLTEPGRQDASRTVHNPVRLVIRASTGRAPAET